MKITFTKHPEKTTIKYTKSDWNTGFYNISGFFVFHDIMHLAVEKTLNMKNGFYGILYNWITIQDFQQAWASQKIAIPDSWVEIFVQHISSIYNGLLENTIDHIPGKYIEMREYSQEKQDEILEKAREMLMDWEEVEVWGGREREVVVEII
jgi:predicted XRE-type DNA-binding protein